MAPDISRQAFLRRGLGTVAAVLLGSCGETPERSALADAPDWGALAESIQGQVTLPSSADYAGAKNLFNSRYDNSTPAAVVTVQSTGDVQQAVAFAASNGARLPRVAAGIPTSVPLRQMVSWSSTCVSCRATPPTTTKAVSRRFRLGQTWIRCRQHWPHRDD